MNKNLTTGTALMLLIDSTCRPITASYEFKDCKHICNILLFTNNSNNFFPNQKSKVLGLLGPNFPLII